MHLDRNLRREGEGREEQGREGEREGQRDEGVEAGREGKGLRFYTCVRLEYGTYRI